MKPGKLLSNKLSYDLCGGWVTPMVWGRVKNTICIEVQKKILQNKIFRVKPIFEELDLMKTQSLTNEK